MQNIKSRLGVTALAAILLCVASSWAADARTNLLRNPSFEAGKAGPPPAGWERYWFWRGAGWSQEREWRIVAALWQVDEQVAHSGKRSAKICHHRFCSRMDFAGGYVQRAVAEVRGDRTYTLSAYVKASKATKVRLFLWGDVPEWGPEYESAGSRDVTIGPQWQRISHTVTFRPEVKSINVLVLRMRNVIGGDLWMDDVQLEQGRKATAYRGE